MRAAGPLTRAALPALGLLVVAACARDAGSSARPERRALLLFELADGAVTDEARLAELIDVAGDARRRTSLYDALERLRGAGRPEVRGVERLDRLGRVVVDVSCRLEGNAEALYTVQLEPGGDGRLRVTAFDGPGVSWPPRGRSSGTGLSSSPEP